MNTVKYPFNKVAIVGVGSVGSTAAYTLMQTGIVSEIALIDTDTKKVAGEVADLQHGIQFTRLTKISGGSSFELVKDAQVIVITAGKNQNPEGDLLKGGLLQETRDDLLLANYKLFQTLIPQIIAINKEAILLIVTNPVDVMTTVALHLSNLNSCQVFGTGTVLDSARLRYKLGKILQVSPKDIFANVLGEHGDNQFIAWSNATVAGIPLSTFKTFSEEEKNKIAEHVKEAAYDIINKKGSTCYAISLVISKIVSAILLNQSRLFTLSTVTHASRNNKPFCMSLPTILTSAGICRTIPFTLSEQEQNKWNQAENHILSLLEKIEL